MSTTLTTRCVSDEALCVCNVAHGDHHLADHLFELADGEDPTCGDVEECTGCGAPMCATHEDWRLVARCVDGGVHHADPEDCAIDCRPCVDDARDQLACDRAEARRDADAWGW